MDDQTFQPDPPVCPGCLERDRRIAQLQSRVEHLEQLVAQLQRGSKRQAAPFAKTPPKADPKTPGRKPGKDYGTKAFRATPPTIDEEHHAPLPEQCPHCGQRHLLLERLDDQYQTEIPTRPIHRRFRVAVGVCCDCHRRVQGRHPLQTSDALGCCASQLGPDAQALAVHLNKHAGLSHGKISDLFHTLFDIKLSRGGVCQTMLRTAKRCEDQYQTIVQHVQRSPWAVPDETGWRVAGLGAWLHVAVGAEATAYLIARERGFDASQRLLGADYQGVVIHDGWAPYERFFHATHQTCLAHLLRRGHELLQNATGGAVRFPRQIRAILHEALDTRNQRHAKVITPEAASAVADELQQRIVRLTRLTKTHPGNERFAAHLFRQQNHLFAFLRQPDIDATNWRAEQAIRPAVVNRKVWGGNRTWHGAEAQRILMSIWQTATRHAIAPMHWLSQHLRSPSYAPALLHTHT